MNKDDGISAKTGNYRPTFEELLQDIRDKKCNTIVVLKLDRLTRSVYDMEGIMKFLDENNVYLDCANEEINTTNSSGKMVARLLTTVSQNEIERTSGRTKFGLAGAIKEDYPSFNLFSIVGTWESVNLNPTVIIYRNDKEYLLSIIYVSETTKQASPATYEIQQDGSQYFIIAASKRLYIDYDPGKDVLSISPLGDYLRN